jgi:hypothetical protein
LLFGSSFLQGNIYLLAICVKDLPPIKCGRLLEVSPSVCPCDLENLTNLVERFHRIGDGTAPTGKPVKYLAIATIGVQILRKTKIVSISQLKSHWSDLDVVPLLLQPYFVKLLRLETPPTTMYGPTAESMEISECVQKS